MNLNQKPQEMLHFASEQRENEKDEENSIIYRY